MRAGAPAGLCAALVVAGCGMFGGGETPPEDAIIPIDVTEITLSVAPGVHGNSPVRIDLIRVTDEGEFKRLLQTDATEWFADGARTFIDTHPDASVERYEVVPGTEVGPFEVRVDEDVVGVLLCEIAGEHGHVQRVVLSGHLRVHATERGGCTLTLWEDVE